MILALASSVFVACTANLGGSSQEGSSKDSDNKGQPGASPAESSPFSSPATVEELALDESECAPSSVSERLLTKDQYQHVIRDVFAELDLPTRELTERLPPATRVAGFSANVDRTVDKLFLTELIAMAEIVGDLVANSCPQLELGCEDGRACASIFVAKYGRRAFRRSLSEAEIEGLLLRHFDSETDFSIAIGQLAQTLLLAADTLYQYEEAPTVREDQAIVSSTDLASILSFFLWDSAPDDALLLASASILTGERLIYNRQPIVYDFNGRSGYGPGVDSIDQWLSEKLKDECPIGDLRAGFRNTGNRDAIDRTISFKDGLPVFRHQKPLDLFKEVFANAVDNSTDKAELEARMRRRQSVLDSIRESVHRVEGRASRFDQIKIEHHLDSIRDLEKSLVAEVPTGELCIVPDSPNDPGQDANVAVPLYNEIITRAFACGITRVAGFFLGTNTQSYNYGFLPGAGSGFHGRTHDDGNDAFVRSVLAWRANMWVDLMSRMDAVMEPNGKTLLDNSLIYFTSDLPWNHTSSDHLIVLAGGAGRFKMGQMKKLSGSTTNDVLTSIAHTMGFEVPQFGNENWGKGPLPSSVFS